MPRTRVYIEGFRDVIDISIINKTIGVLIGNTLAVGILSGFFFYLFRHFFLTRFLSAFGLTYFSDMKELYQELGKLVILSMGKLSADRAILYRTYNGKSYISTDERTLKKVRAVVNQSLHRGLRPLPNKLDEHPEFIPLFGLIMSQPSFTEFFVGDFVDDLPSMSRAKTALLSYGVESFMALKIRDERGHLYGVIFYTWSTFRNMPRNLNGIYASLDDATYNKVIDKDPHVIKFQRNREYLINLRNMVSNTFIAIIHRLIFEKLRLCFGRCLKWNPQIQK